MASRKILFSKGYTHIDMDTLECSLQPISKKNKFMLYPIAYPNKDISDVEISHENIRRHYSFQCLTPRAI